MKNSPFDQIASGYDKSFTNTLVGRAQRDIVWRYLERRLPETPLRILELNCGTGEDAVWLAKRGHRVTATDASATMIAITKQKAESAGVELSSFVWDITTPYERNEQYDLIFSNFGGLNCISPQQIHALFNNLHHILSPEGSIISVVIGKFCPWEKFLFTLKGKWQSASRRHSDGPVTARITDTKTVQIWYYNSIDLDKIASPSFYITQSLPIGLFIPPSYGKNAWWHIKPLISILKYAEVVLSSIPLFRNTGDHLLITLKKRAE